MQEWEQLIERTHKAGMKVIMDFVPNHVAREYHSICKPTGVRDLGEDEMCIRDRTETQKSLQEIVKNRYVYQKALLDEVVYSILYSASDKAYGRDRPAHPRHPGGCH